MSKVYPIIRNTLKNKQSEIKIKKKQCFYTILRKLIKSRDLFNTRKPKKFSSSTQIYLGISLTLRSDYSVIKEQKYIWHIFGRIPFTSKHHFIAGHSPWGIPERIRYQSSYTISWVFNKLSLIFFVSQSPPGGIPFLPDPKPSRLYNSTSRNVYHVVLLEPEWGAAWNHCSNYF